MKKEIGIDLGTTYSCVGIYQNNNVEIIANNTGEYTIPSVVSFLDKGGILIGRPAKNSLIRNYTNTIYNSKRLIGRKYNDKEVQYEKEHCSFKIIEENDIKCPLIELENLKENEKKYYYAQEISTLILKKIKETAEEYLNVEVTDAVITVPAYFNELQRQATKDAGKMAGLNVLRIINEPTAAAIAYGLQNNNLKNKCILVFDLGGGTFDVSVLTISNEGVIIIKSTCGNSHLGGEDFDNRLMEECMKIFKNKTGIDISDNRKAKIRLKLACETAKIELSSLLQTKIDIDNIVPDEDLNIDITRTEFENYCQDLFKQCIPYIKKAIKDANINKNDIDDIVLVGGSSNIPKIKEMVKKFFERDKLTSSININPSEAVAYGASYLASFIKKNIEDEKVVLLDIIGISIGIVILDGKMQIILPKGTTIPNSQTIEIETSYDNQTTINISIYQGEDIDHVSNNCLIKTILINDINKAPAGKMKFDITFNIDYNACLSIQIKDLQTQNSKTFTLVDSYSKNYEISILKRLKQKENEIKKKLLDTNYKDYRNELISLCMQEIEKGNPNAQKIIDKIKKKKMPVFEEKYQSYLNELFDY